MKKITKVKEKEERKKKLLRSFTLVYYVFKFNVHNVLQKILDHRDIYHWSYYIHNRQRDLLNGIFHLTHKYINRIKPINEHKLSSFNAIYVGIKLKFDKKNEFNSNHYIMKG